MYTENPVHRKGRGKDTRIQAWTGSLLPPFVDKSRVAR